VVAAFDGGKITSDADAVLLGATDRTIRLVDRFAACRTAVRGSWSNTRCQRLLGCVRLGLRWATKTWSTTTSCAMTPVMAVLAGKLAARRSDGAPLAGKSTLNPAGAGRPEPTR